MSGPSNVIAMEPPRASFLVTAFVGMILLFSQLSMFVIQIALALVTFPLLLCDKNRFFFLQSAVWRSGMAILSVFCNPFWSSKVMLLGDEPGPPSAADGKGCIFFCNHRSSADPWFSSCVLVKICAEGKYVYKSSLGKVPVFGWSLVMVGDLSAQFGNKEKIASMLDRTKELLNAGYNVVVFPEGTRSPSGILQDFKPSFFKICAETGCAAVPMVMTGTEKAWPLGGVRMGCAKVVSGVGEPIYASGRDGWEDLMHSVESRMLGMARELLEEGEGQVRQEDCLDPYITGLPYPYWTPPPELEGLSKEEQIKRLRSGQAHQRGAKLL